MGNLDPTKIAIILIVALLVLGPDKLPGFVKQAGAWWGEFQRIKARLQAEVNGAVSQINTVAAPFSETFTSASTSVSGFVQSVFSGTEQPTQSANVSIDGTANQYKRPFDSVQPENSSGWGVGEQESGYIYGDPRLN